ncbi:HlyU family transcriptional regulator, partial [Brucella melitensis]|uniref:HlyU family transcriptional regulator n=1 Tax=Brucella melitensis TaxID=29459 RepID=UPI0032B78F21
GFPPNGSCPGRRVRLQDNQYQVCGVISKTIDGEVKEYRFVRADRCPGIEDAASIALNKGRQIIDEQGERIFG